MTKPGAKPITQGWCTIPVQYWAQIKEKLEEVKDNKIVEGPVPANEGNGWVQNKVITEMNKHVLKTKHTILTPEELWYDLVDNNQLTVLDASDTFYHFLLIK